MSKPDIDSRRKLAAAGLKSHDPLDVVNEFYKHPGDNEYDVFSEWWQIRICILAERIAAAERQREELQKQNFALIQAGQQIIESIETLRKGDGGLVSPALCTLKKAMQV